MKILLIDNYDSFTYNLYQYIAEFCSNIEVYRNDEITLDNVLKNSPDKIIISPGPGHPRDSKVSFEIVKNIHNIPILGVCLGHQAIGLAYGCNIIYAKNLMHGKTSLINHNNSKLFYDIPEIFEATRYHSLVIDNNSVNEKLEVIAFSEDDNEIMAIKHKKFPIYGVQFHPESYQTSVGKKLIKNFLEVL
ncbi:MAG TPA: aminodeoxychorismate/anthranilate synthase component II [Ignavibacteriales bacterium]|nr:aminodeoxychorismate/anthranilate synthase component II [Ignavibacteriales bacterium]HOL80844.1 aminodeoxychorismate/anthranilate synthase component II [Ignavibacteriales bacterium]HOM65871.1 aminodeoxychorismate/anthranilate synthase component II [Ignavibacteriales bacterium]HPD67627.1 aminodeoxychorismate/anthranilate synthase component II [Ignavibacteriales bacterium]HPP33280.1 aminodeoxychorismate/anthranilate synthase component II [Ignavibacteriales bacterium]